MLSPLAPGLPATRLAALHAAGTRYRDDMHVVGPDFLAAGCAPLTWGEFRLLLQRGLAAASDPSASLLYGTDVALSEALTGSPTPWPPSPAHCLRAIVSHAPGTAPIPPAGLWEDALVGRKYDAAPREWTHPTPAPRITLVCPCGWQSGPVDTPDGTRVTQPTHAAVDPVLLTSNAFLTQCVDAWAAHLPPPSHAGSS